MPAGFAEATLTVAATTIIAASLMQSTIPEQQHPGNEQHSSNNCLSATEPYHD